jgi:DNA-binding transcriptional MerR regulator
MPVYIKDRKFYKTAEACKKAGVSRATLFRWLKNQTFKDVANKDRRGWRLFTENDIQRLKKEADRIHISPYQQSLDFNERKKPKIRKQKKTE